MSSHRTSSHTTHTVRTTSTTHRIVVHHVTVVRHSYYYRSTHGAGLGLTLFVLLLLVLVVWLVARRAR
ncbi:hypothetical protein [Kitasatospora sp. NBC_01266]|uniref:hypothetical protein n=1 Tax=Kitasatospora sp. NBC_01266 TaxID=2903572 RepID=UPI002E354458|nr:hypothetical protein [Kitasatospora sp. NBC_01266]